MKLKANSTNVSGRFTTYPEVTAFLFAQLPMYQQVGKIAYKANLQTPEEWDDYLGQPHKKFESIHVAGTNGKGSVSHMLAAVLQAAGYKVGLYTSPHLKDFRERVKINGTPVPEEEVVSFVNAHRPFIEKTKPSFFEMTTALALDYFARNKVDVAVIETGMGGRLDATNVICPVLSVITNIGLDHTEHLGDSLALIAGEKSGIIKPHVPVLIGESTPETTAVFKETAQQRKSPLFFATDYVRVFPEGQSNGLQHFRVAFCGASLNDLQVSVDLLGDYQRKNLGTVITAIDILRYAVSFPFIIRGSECRYGLARAARLTGLRGRWEIIGEQPLIICDTGHNAHGLQCTFEQLSRIACDHLHIVFGVVADKDLSAVLPLLPKQAKYYFTQADLPRALDAATLAEQCIAAGLTGEVIPGVVAALSRVGETAGKNDVIFVGGSNFVVAEVLPDQPFKGVLS